MHECTHCQQLNLVGSEKLSLNYFVLQSAQVFWSQNREELF